MPYPTYTIATDTANARLAKGKLKTEIIALSLATARILGIRIAIDGLTFMVLCDVEPDASDKTSIDDAVTAHTGVDSTRLQLHSTSTVVELERAITSDGTFEDLGGARTSVDFYMPDETRAISKIVGDVKTVGTGAELRLVKSDSDIVVSPVLVPGDTTGAWVAMSIVSIDAKLDANTQIYKLQGRLNGATSASVRFVSMSLLEAIFR